MTPGPVEALVEAGGEAARAVAEFYEGKLAELAERVKAAERERDEMKEAADGMARAPYGQFGEWVDRARAAEAQLADIRRQMEQARSEGNWPLAEVIAQRDELVEALADLLDNGMPYKARVALAKVRGEAE